MLQPYHLIEDERAAYLARYHAMKTPQAERKQKAINFLGGRCACCGESFLVMMSIDHVLNDGHKERSGNIYARVLNTRDRARYQALCLNCNQAKGRGQECEHQAQARALIWQHLGA